MFATAPREQISAGATAALRDGMRERRRREWSDREGLSSTFRRKMRPRSGMPAPSRSIIAVAASPSAARSRFAAPRVPDPASRAPRATLWGRPFARSLTRQTACKARPTRVAVKSGAHGVALLRIVVPATTSVARLIIIPILTATRSARICSAVP